MTCKPCAKAGIERTATRILDGHGPCCEACVRERYRPAWMQRMSDEELEKFLDREAA